MGMIELTQEDCQTLEDDSIFLPCNHRGKCKISASFLVDSAMQSPSSGSSTTSVSSSSSTASVRYVSEKIQKDTVVAERLDSAEALEFIGLNPETASKIFNRWVSRPKGNPDGLLDYVYGHTGQLRRDSWANYSDAQACDMLGIASWLKDAILHSDYSGIYFTHDLKHWLDRSMRTNFNSLARILSRLKVHATVRGKGENTEQKRTSLGDVFLNAPGASSSPETSSRFPHPHVYVGNAGPMLADHEVFYKAKAIDEIASDKAFIDENGNIEMDVIRSHAGGDFNPREPAWYFTAEKDTAHAYKAYAEKRCPNCEVWIICIQVPKSFTATLRKEELWFSHDWRAYVWHCKKGHKSHEMPDKYHKFWLPGPNRTDLIVGHICKGSETRPISRIPKDRVQTEIDRDETGTQWVVMQEPAAERLARAVRSKMHVEIYVGRKPEGK
ncbi:uncharacterized protein J3D65DRAFT_591484 [Phyllosticta citribraziliensis]|uniref:Uncharacterized protein n=1 Tax=Phyllosticta citribraziliensis TaxID=989973 RepID=A0ABR1LJL6_9PEZI